MNVANAELLHLLQLASSSLPVGAYSYSEGLELLVEQNVVDKRDKLCCWIERELCEGTIRIEAAVMLRAVENWPDRDCLEAWNAWLSASRETQELRQQSWQMGESLLRLMASLQPELRSFAEIKPCNYAIAWGIAIAAWQIDPKDAIAAYLHAWAANLVSAGVKLIPLGQTEGQQILFGLRDRILTATREIIALQDDELDSCTWGLSLASMNHETQYTRLFRS
ncbi:urease accessory protein UreF [Oscillatoria sp. FACHB-1406]|uniref:urease accessory protein UreF n=1 Tax=Oscillatoria sp. FACHB-1406 TaxID=2692846 RepID=UPI00322046BF